MRLTVNLSSHAQATLVPWTACEGKTIAYFDGLVFLKLSAEKLLLFKWSQAQIQHFLNGYEISRVHEPLFKFFFKNWPRRQKFNRLLHAGKAIAFYFSHHIVTLLITLYVHFLCSDWSKFDRWVHAGKFMQRLASWSWQSFVSSSDVCNCLFLLHIQNEIQLLSRLFCNSWLVCLLRFWLRNPPLVKVIGNPISDGIFFEMSLLTCPCLRRIKRVEKSQAILASLDDLQQKHLDW